MPAVKYPGTGYGLVEIFGYGYGYGYNQLYRTRHFGKLGFDFPILVSDTLVSLVRLPYPYPTLVKFGMLAAKYTLVPGTALLKYPDAGTGTAITSRIVPDTLVSLRTTYIPAPDTLASSVRLR